MPARLFIATDGSMTTGAVRHYFILVVLLLTATTLFSESRYDLLAALLVTAWITLMPLPGRRRTNGVDGDVRRERVRRMDPVAVSGAAA